MHRCILATVCDTVTGLITLRGCCDGRQTFNRPINAVVLRIQPHLRSYKRAVRGSAKEYKKNDVYIGYAGISGLGNEKQNLGAQTEEKDHCPEDILSTDDAETLAEWLSLLWHGVLGYKSIAT